MKKEKMITKSIRKESHIQEVGELLFLSKEQQKKEKKKRVNLQPVQVEEAVVKQKDVKKTISMFTFHDWNFLSLIYQKIHYLMKKVEQDHIQVELQEIDIIQE